MRAVSRLGTTISPQMPLHHRSPSPIINVSFAPRKHVNLIYRILWVPNWRNQPCFTRPPYLAYIVSRPSETEVSIFGDSDEGDGLSPDLPAVTFRLLTLLAQLWHFFAIFQGFVNLWLSWRSKPLIRPNNLMSYSLFFRRDEPRYPSSLHPDCRNERE